LKLGVGHACHLCTGETEAEESLVPSQPGLPSKTLFQKTKPKITGTTITTKKKQNQNHLIIF
jgi:hypothetical protein